MSHCHRASKILHVINHKAWSLNTTRSISWRRCSYNQESPRLAASTRPLDVSVVLSSRKETTFGRTVLARFASQQSSRNDFQRKSDSIRTKSIVLYLSGLTVLVVGLSYAAVPLYRIFCQSTGYGGETVKILDASKVETMRKVKDRLIKVRFNADISSTMSWKFMPQQSEIYVAPGETALAFYTATNPLDIPVIGIATYNVIPFEAGQYFNKIQCFCFEEQRLNPNEQVDMPVFFYIDPDFNDDPKMENVDVLTLSYTFFESKEGISLPIPFYAKH